MIFLPIVLLMTSSETVDVKQYGYSCVTHNVSEFRNAVNESEAIEISKKYLIELFGEEAVREEEPFTGVLKGGVWIVRGYIPSDHIGGTFVVRLNAKSGCVLDYSDNM